MATSCASQGSQDDAPPSQEPEVIRAIVFEDSPYFSHARQCCVRASRTAHLRRLRREPSLPPLFLPPGLFRHHRPARPLHLIQPEVIRAIMLEGSPYMCCVNKSTHTPCIQPQPELTRAIMSEAVHMWGRPCKSLGIL